MLLAPLDQELQVKTVLVTSYNSHRKKLAVARKPDISQIDYSATDTVYRSKKYILQAELLQYDILRLRFNAW